MQTKNQDESVGTTAKNNVPKVRVVTEADIAKEPIPCGYTPDIVVQMNFRITNVLYCDIADRCKHSGFKNVAEYFQQAVREKLYYDDLAETDLMRKKGLYQ